MRNFVGAKFSEGEMKIPFVPIFSTRNYRISS